MTKFEKQLTENGAHMNCLNNLMAFLSNNSNATASQVHEQFVMPNIAKCLKELDEMSNKMNHKFKE